MDGLSTNEPMLGEIASAPPVTRVWVQDPRELPPCEGGGTRGGGGGVKSGRDGAPKIYARSRSVIVAFANVGEGCRTKSKYELRLLPCVVGVGQSVGDGVIIPRLGDLVGDGEELRGIEVGGRGQADKIGRAHV